VRKDKKIKIKIRINQKKLKEIRWPYIPLYLANNHRADERNVEKYRMIFIKPIDLTILPQTQPWGSTSGGYSASIRSACAKTRSSPRLLRAQEQQVGGGWGEWVAATAVSVMRRRRRRRRRHRGWAAMGGRAGVVVAR
jgi:hypothetical protein